PRRHPAPLARGPLLPRRQGRRPAPHRRLDRPAAPTGLLRPRLPPRAPRRSLSCPRRRLPVRQAGPRHHSHPPLRRPHDLPPRHPLRHVRLHPPRRGRLLVLHPPRPGRHLPHRGGPRPRHPLRLRDRRRPRPAPRARRPHRRPRRQRRRPAPQQGQQLPRRQGPHPRVDDQAALPRQGRRHRPAPRGRAHHPRALRQGRRGRFRHGARQQPDGPARVLQRHLPQARALGGQDARRRAGREGDAQEEEVKQLYLCRLCFRSSSYGALI
ncbi:hypothetical protein CCHR01_18303, partial [Colletotrichum chrysophilum]